MGARLPVVALCAALSGWAASAGQARADVIYTFNVTTRRIPPGSAAARQGSHSASI